MGKRSGYSSLYKEEDKGCCCCRCLKSLCCCFFGCAKCLLGTICWIVIIAVILGVLYLGMSIGIWYWVKDLTWTFSSDARSLAKQSEFYDGETGYYETTWVIPTTVIPGWDSWALGATVSKVEFDGFDWIDVGHCTAEASWSSLESKVEMYEEIPYEILVAYTLRYHCKDSEGHEQLPPPVFTVERVPNIYSLNVNFWEVFPAGPNRMPAYIEEMHIDDEWAGSMTLDVGTD